MRVDCGEDGGWLVGEKTGERPAVKRVERVEGRRGSWLRKRGTKRGQTGRERYR